MTPTPELRPLETKQYEGLDTVSLKDASDKRLNELADGIVNNPQNQEQVKFFPDKWDSLTSEQKSEFVLKLSSEIQDSIKELSELGVEYTPEISEKDVSNVEALNFVRSNKEKIPHSWAKLETKANEVAKEMGKEVEDTGILNVMK